MSASKRQFGVLLHPHFILTPDQQKELGGIVAGELEPMMHHLLTGGRCDGIKHIDVACSGDVYVMVTRIGEPIANGQLREIGKLLEGPVPIFVKAIAHAPHPVPVTIVVTAEEEVRNA